MPLTYLQIGSWNIEHLSKAGGRKESPYALTDHIEMAGIDVLALQEVYDTSPPGGGRRNRELTKVCQLLEEHSGEKWEYELFPNRKANDTTQLCGVLWNTTRVEKTGVFKADVDHRVEVQNPQATLNLWDRAPHAVRFSAKYKDETKSVVVVPLHMKSNFGGAGKAKRVRREEARQLAGQLAAIRNHFEDESLVLIGDTNVLDANEEAIRVFEAAGLVDLNSEDAPTFPGHRPRPFDRAFVAEGRREFKYTRQYVLQSTNSDEHDKFLSDHYMIRISVKLYADDNDPR